MQAEVISIGDELTSGQRLDTNSQWLSQQLAQLGIRVLFHTTVGDDLSANVDVFRAAMKRADIIVATGGLGPTADDLTRQAIADAVELPLQLDEQVLLQIQERFVQHGRTMPAQNRTQALFPAGSQVIPNPEGTAPGIDISYARPGKSPSRTFALPGVPAEMQQMWAASVEPALSESGRGRRRVICHRAIKCFGIGESHLEEMLPDIIRRGREPSVGITVHKATITLRITAEGPTRQEALATMVPTVAIIREKLGNLVFGEEDDEMEHAVFRLLKQHSLTLATAESGTLGLVSECLGRLPGVAQIFRGGITVTADSAAISENLYTQAGVEALAAKVRDDFGADLGLAVGAFPPLKAGDEVPGEFFLALADSDRVHSVQRRFAGHSDIRRERSAKQALDLVRLWVINNGTL